MLGVTVTTGLFNKSQSFGLAAQCCGCNSHYRLACAVLAKNTL